jgi:hypothetical protein
MTDQLTIAQIMIYRLSDRGWEFRKDAPSEVSKSRSNKLAVARVSGVGFVDETSIIHQDVYPEFVIWAQLRSEWSGILGFGEARDIVSSESFVEEISV